MGPSLLLLSAFASSDAVPVQELVALDLLFCLAKGRLLLSTSAFLDWRRRAGLL